MPLLDTNVALDATVYRNIVSLRTSVNLFDDLVADPAEQALANRVEMRTRPDTPANVIHRGFAYNMAIAHPFAPDQVTQSRFSDGSFGVWYGALEEATAERETAWHALQQVRQTPQIDRPVRRQRLVWTVHADGLFIDLREKVDEMPALVGDSYAATQGLGKQLSRHHPGLLTPSARARDGSCLAAFTPDVLDTPRQAHYLDYSIDPTAGTVAVTRRRGTAVTTYTEADLAPRG